MCSLLFHLQKYNFQTHIFFPKIYFHNIILLFYCHWKTIFSLYFSQSGTCWTGIFLDIGETFILLTYNFILCLKIFESLAPSPQFQKERESSSVSDVCQRAELVVFGKYSFFGQILWNQDRRSCVVTVWFLLAWAALQRWLIQFTWPSKSPFFYKIF